MPIRGSHALCPPLRKEQHGAASSEMAEEDDELFEEAPFDSIDKVQVGADKQCSSWLPACLGTLTRSRSLPCRADPGRQRR